VTVPVGTVSPDPGVATAAVTTATAPTVRTAVAAATRPARRRAADPVGAVVRGVSMGCLLGVATLSPRRGATVNALAGRLPQGAPGVRPACGTPLPRDRAKVAPRPVRATCARSREDVVPHGGQGAWHRPRRHGRTSGRGAGW